MKHVRERSLALVLCGALVAGLVSPEAARAAALARPGARAGAGVVAPVPTAVVAPLTLGTPSPLAPLASSPGLAPGSAADAVVAPADAVVAPAVAGVLAAAPDPAAASAAAPSPDERAPAPAKAAGPAGSYLSRAVASFSSRAAPVAAAPAADAKAASDKIFDGASARSGEGSAVAVPRGRLGRLGAGLRRFAARRVEAYKARRAVAHDGYGGPKYDGPTSFGTKVAYGVKWGLNLVGLAAILDATVIPLLARVPWPMFLSPAALGHFGRVILMTRFGPGAIGAALTHSPLSFLTIALPASTFGEEITFRLLGFGLTFGLLASAEPVARLVARLLDQIPDGANVRSRVQRLLVAAGRFVSYFAYPVAILTSSFNFAVAHFALWGANPAVLALNLVAGYVLARTAYKTRSLSAPFVAHLVFNLAMLGSGILGTTLGLPLAAAAYGVILPIVGVLALWYNWRVGRRLRALAAAAMKAAGGGAKNLLIAVLVSSTLLGTMIPSSSRGVPAPAHYVQLRETPAPSSVWTPEPMFAAVDPDAAVDAAGSSPVPAPTDADEEASRETDADMIARVKPSVLQIIVNVSKGTMTGSGVIVSPSGLLVTNGHVIGDKKVGEIVQAKLANGQSVPAKIMAFNHNRDLAILLLPLRSDGAAWPYSTFAAAAPREGDPLFVMGHPLALPFTVTKGIVSGMGSRGNMFVQYIQTDASINHGNSGGPLYNERGEIVGINTMIMGKEGSIGLGFAINTPDVVRALKQYSATGNIATAALGVIVDLSDPRQPEAGIAVEIVLPGSAAAKAGLRPGDVIVSVAGRPLPGGGRRAVHALATVLARGKPGDTIELGVMRGDAERPLTYKATLDASATSEETSLAHELDER